MKTVRKLHLWLGVLFAPAIFFFAFSGALQILGLHEGNDAAGWIARLGLVHKDQRFAEIERRPPRPPAAAVKPHEDPAPKASPPPRSMVLVVFFLMMAVGLMTSTALGVYLAFGYRRDRRVIFALLGAGIAIPVIGLFL